MKLNTIVEYYPSDNNLSLIPFKVYVADEKGIKQGRWKLYYPCGSLEEVAHYTDGKLNGSYKSYYMDGSEQTIGHYTNGRKNGEFKSFYKSGLLDEVITYRNGKKQGTYKKYNTKGELIQFGTILPDGSFKPNVRLNPERKALSAVLNEIDKEMSPTQLRRSFKVALVDVYRQHFSKELER